MKSVVVFGVGEYFHALLGALKLVKAKAQEGLFRDRVPFLTTLFNTINVESGVSLHQEYRF